MIAVKNNITPAKRLGDFKQLYVIVIQLAPSKFRPKAHAHICRNHIFNGGGIVAFKNDVRRKACMAAKAVANPAKLP